MTYTVDMMLERACNAHGLSPEVAAGGPCFSCQTPCTSDNHCPGCGAFVCDACDLTGGWGNHDRTVHLAHPKTAHRQPPPVEETDDYGSHP